MIRETYGATAITRVMVGRTSATQLFQDRKSTRLNSSHSQISYAVFCLKKKKNTITWCTQLYHGDYEYMSQLASPHSHGRCIVDGAGRLRQAAYASDYSRMLKSGMYVTLTHARRW